MAVIALPDARHHDDLRAVYLLFVCGCSATYVVGAAARRLYYYASQIPMLGVVGVTFLLSGDRVTRLLGFAVPIYFIVMTSLHHEVHNVVISELQLQERNDEANVALRAANTQLSQQALRDDLTGLANRAAFMDRLGAAVASARRERNDDRGPLSRRRPVQGDQRLARSRRGRHGADRGRGRIMKVIRSRDVLARLGGDEFTMLLDGVHGRAEADRDRGARRRLLRRAVRGCRPPVQRVRERRYRDQHRRDRRRRGAALARRRRPVPGQAGRPQPDRGVRHRAARVDPAPARRRAGASRRAGRAADIVAWFQPEVDLRSGADRRRRGVGALDAPRARAARRLEVRPARGGGGARVPSRRPDRGAARSKRGPASPRPVSIRGSASGATCRRAS